MNGIIFIDWRSKHLDKVSKERRAFIEKVCIDQARLNTTRKKYPEGAIWLWSLGSVFGPVGSADKVEAET